MALRADSVWEAERVTALTPDSDQFGHLDYAETIAGVLKIATPPFTLGLYGPWGVGKTLIIEAACKKIEADCAYAIYDAWRYDGDTLRRHFLRDVATTLEKNGALDGYDVDEKLNDLDVQTIDPKDTGYEFDWKYLLIVLGALGVVMALGALALWLFTDTHRLWAWLVGIGGGVLALAIASAISPFARVIKIAQVTEVRQRVVDPEVFTAKFIELLEHVNKKRVVIAIDNLDRCSPERVTELLETLNTYLEPAGRKDGGDSQDKRTKGAEAVFLVAADDGALKRHIESKEAKRSEGLDGDGQRADVGRYADEYLRKIFIATIPIKPALSTELKAYVAKQTESLVKDREIAAQDQTRLVEVIAEGLKRNPRRVTQFVRNLELRLLLLAERHESKKMADDLSTSEHVPFVAKLLILEEEWPAAYGALDSDRTLLRQWHEQQAAQVWAGDGSSDTFRFARLKDLSNSETRQFAAFLGVTRSVQSAQLSAFLSLKQSEHEVRLPRFADFTESLLNSDAQGLSEITDSLSEDEAVAYAGTLIDIAKAHSDYPDTVRAIVETAVNDQELRAKAYAQLADFLRWALNEPSRRSGLRSVPADRMLPLAATLTNPDFNAVVRLYTVTDDDEPGELPTDALVALPSDTPKRFDGATTTAIRKALQTEAMEANPGAILRVLEWWPAGATSEIAASSTTRFADDEDAGSVEARILEICLTSVWRAAAAKANSQIASQRDLILDAARARIASFFTTAPPAPEDERLEVVEQLVPLIRAVADDVVGSGAESRANLITPLGAALDQSRPAMDDDRLVAPVLELVGAVGLIGGDAFVPTTRGIVQQFVAQRPQVLAAYAASAGEKVPSALVPELALGLDGIVRTGDDLEALAGLVALDSVDDGNTLAGALTQAVNGERYGFLEQAIAAHPTELQQFRHSLGVAALGSDSDEGVRFAVKQSDTFDSEQLDLLAEKVAQQLVDLADDDCDDATALIDEIESTALSAKLDSIVNQLWDDAKVQDVAPINLVGLIATHSGRLDKSRKAAFVERLDDWFREGAGEKLAEVLEDAALTAGDRKRLVETILGYQASGSVLASDHATRASLFRAASGIAGTSKTKARKTVDEAREALNSDSSTPDDKEVFELLHTEVD